MAGRELHQPTAGGGACMTCMRFVLARLKSENETMREAINGVSKILQSIQLNDIFEETMRNHAVLALAKLAPFLP